MITYKLSHFGDFANKIVDGVETGEWHNTQTNKEYLDWIAEGNTPEPNDAPRGE
jgi:hypothetical protein